MGAIKGCIPLRLRSDQLEGAARQALVEWRQGNKPWPTILDELLSTRWSNAPLRQEAVSLVGKNWRPTSTIGVRFLDGSPMQRKKCQQYAEQWLDYANLSMAWGVSRGEIIVSFAPGPSYSLIGTDCLAVTHGATLQLGWVTDTSDEASDRAVILHEFGHALGLGHEQSHPMADIQWDRARAEAYYRLNQGWDEKTIELNVFDVYGHDQVEHTPYDRTSVMQYPVPAELTLDGQGIGFNSTLSDYDQQHVAALYPGKVSPRNPVPPLPSADEFPAPNTVVGLDLAGTIARARAFPGQPARWQMQVLKRGRITLQFKVGDVYGRSPIVVGKSSDGPAFPIALVNGFATLDFDPGEYELALYHPMPNETVLAGAKAVLRA
jgi:hypothetical protein